MGVCVRVYVYVFTCLRVYLYVFTCLRICVCIYLFACICVCVYLFACIYTQTIIAPSITLYYITRYYPLHMVFALITTPYKCVVHVRGRDFLSGKTH